jgi:nitrogen-specific signal transduction histidine kinase
LGHNSAVPHHDKPGVSKELLHEVNNQFEIIVGAAELLSGKSPDPSIKNYCEQIQSAVFRTSKLLKDHFQGAMAIEPSGDGIPETGSPVVLDQA